MNHNHIRVISVLFLFALLTGFPQRAFSEETNTPETGTQDAAAVTASEPVTDSSSPTEEEIKPTPLKTLEIDGKLYHHYGLDVEIKKRMHDVYETEEGNIAYVDRETGMVAGQDSKYHREGAHGLVVAADH